MVSAAALKTDRIEKWDLLRALLIFLVVLGHTADYYTSGSSKMQALFIFIYSFHMPCFLFLDGMFSKRNVNNKNYSRIFSYLILYVLIKFLVFLAKGIAGKGFTFSLFSSQGLAWYALALFWCNLITIFLKRFPKRWVLCATILLACLAGYDNNISDTLVISRTIVFYPFFFMGYCTDPCLLEKRTSPKCAKIAGLLILIAAAVLIFFKIDDIYFIRSLLTGRNPYSVFSSSYEMSKQLVNSGGILRLVYYPVVCLLCAAVIAIIPSHSRALHFLTGVGKRSLQIYILHRPILYILYDGLHLDDLLASRGISNLIIIPLALGLTLLLSVPFLEKPVRAVVYPKVLQKKE